MKKKRKKRSIKEGRKSPVKVEKKGIITVSSALSPVLPVAVVGSPPSKRTRGNPRSFCMVTSRKESHGGNNNQ
jgi:hypothetical protein